MSHLQSCLARTDTAAGRGIETMSLSSKSGYRHLLPPLEEGLDQGHSKDRLRSPPECDKSWAYSWRPLQVSIIDAGIDFLHPLTHSLVSIHLRSR